MGARTIDIDIGEPKSSYQIIISHDVALNAGKWVRNSVGNDVEKAVVVSNPTVFELYGETLVDSLRATGLITSAWLMPDGEEHKSLENLAPVLEAFSNCGLSRTDVVVALGGGVVGDLAGFAASIYLRGVDFVQMPTTLLSMIDSSVGGKTGVNSKAGKNRIGTFYQPRGVLIRTDTLSSLPLREITAGLCEAVKHAVLSGSQLFDQTRAFVERYSVDGLDQCFRDPEGHNALDALIEAQVSFKATIVKSDERESANRTDDRSRKILNLGHTLGHALEQVTKYSYFRHGEAVGYGILFAAELSKKLDFLDADQVNLLYDVVHRTGRLPSLAAIDPSEVLEAFRFDKKMVAGSLQMILLKGIGKPCIIDAASIPRAKLLAAFADLLAKTSI
jgi:3-dehydroquinate synthase